MQTLALYVMPSLILFAAVACTHGDETTSDDTALATSADAETHPTDNAATSPEGSPTEPAGPAPLAAKPMTLGALDDEDMRHTLWKALEQRMTKTQAASESANEETELGDYDSFKFVIVKVLSGKDDISGDTTQAADGLEVEVTGWYKRTLSQSGQEPLASCFSFDAVAPLRLNAGEWTVPTDYQVVFGREDQEDCY